jgi:hypothetical protein
VPSWNVVTVSLSGRCYRLQELTEPKAKAEYARKTLRKGQSIVLTYRGKSVEAKHWEPPKESTPPAEEST